jgi:2-hydroxy-3-oxopropionate reductase
MNRDAEIPVRVALLGLGLMGKAFADRLAEVQFPVTAWTRSGGALSDAHEAVRDADIVVTILADAAAVTSVLFDSGVAGRIRAGATVIDMGTSGPRAAVDHHERLARCGVHYLDAPVSGGVAAARRGQLTIFVGGDAEAFGRARSFLAQLGQPRLLGGVGSGQMAKLANQMIVAVNIAAVAEAIRFAQIFNLDAAALVEALRGGFADSTVLRHHGPRMVNHEFTPGGPCRLHLKDLRLAKELMGGSLAPFGHTNTCLEGFQRLVNAGFAELDHSAYIKLYEAALASGPAA